MKSFADQIVAWPDAPGAAGDLVAGLSMASWLDARVPARRAQVEAERVGDRFTEDFSGLGGNALKLVQRLRETEAIRGGAADAPAMVRLLELTPYQRGAVQPPVPVWWLAIEGCPGRKALSNALLAHIRQAIASMVAEGDNPRRNARCVLIVSVAGPQRQRPDLVVIGPANGGDAQGRGASCIRSFQFSRMRTQGAAYIKSQAEELAAGLTETGLASFFNTRKAGDARHVVRNQLKEQLTGIMELLEGLPGAVVSDTAGDLRALREAATVVVFRMMFLGEIEARGLLWRRDAQRRQLFEAAADALDNEVLVHDETCDLVELFLGLCRALRGTSQDADVEVRGGSLFRTRPNPQFDAAVVEHLGRLDATDLALTGATRGDWRRVLAETFHITQGVVLNRGANVRDVGAREGLGYLGLGGTEHVHRILGDVYEQILALEPKRDKRGRITLSGAETASQRKSLGAHYTPESLVEELVRPALGALFEHHWAACGGDADDYRARISGLRMLDPAMGSAHFLTVAAREIATELEWLDRFGTPRHVEDCDAHEPLRQRDPLLGRSGTPDEASIKAGLVRRLRQVVQRCCHGVDVSPIAVELGKLSLWLFTMAAQQERLDDADIERPELAFLDANIQCGDSLVGLFWRDVRPILSERFGVDLASRAGQMGLFDTHGQLVAERVAAVADPLRHLHGDDAGLLAFARWSKHEALRDGDSGSAYAVRQAMHTWAQDQFADLRWVFDLATLAVFFGVKLSRGSVKADGLEAALFEAGLARGPIDWEAVISEPVSTDTQRVLAVRAALVAVATRGRLVGGRAMRALHWGMAFPDVFAVEGAGFDLIVANPPFIGDRDLRKRVGQATKGFLTAAYTARRRGGTCDLAGFFALRFADLVHAAGASRAAAVASLAPNSLAQAKNRRVVMVPLVNGPDGFVIQRATRSMAWPGDAAVHICVVVLVRGLVARPALVRPSEDARRVIYPARISTFLDDLADQVDPHDDALDLPGGRASLFFQGLLQRGASGAARDFVKAKEEARAFLEEAEEAGERRALFAYLNNEAVQNSRTATAQTICVDFFDVLQEAGLLGCEADDQLAWLQVHYPLCLRSIDDVREARGALPGTSSNSAGSLPWWSHWRPRPELRRLWEPEETVVLVGTAASKIWCLSNVSKVDPTWDLPICPSHALSVLPSSGSTAFAVLQSALGELHVRRCSSTLETRLRFSPEYALAGFPFPWPTRWSDAHQAPYPLPAPQGAQARLNEAGERVTQVRNRLLGDPEAALPEVHPVPADWGPTELYNRYDDAGFDAPGILALRRAHVALLDAVLGAYAADASLPEAAPLFALLRRDMAADEGHGWCFDRPWIDWTGRYVPKAEYRRRIIEALLQANLERWTQEIDLVAEKLGEVIGSDRTLARRFARGAQVDGLLKGLKKSPLKIHQDDARAVLDAGVRAGQWVPFHHGAAPVYRWVGDDAAARKSALGAAERERARTEAEERRKEQAEARRQKPVRAPKRRKRSTAPSGSQPMLGLPLSDGPAAGSPSSQLLPFRRVDQPAAEQRYVSCVPLISLELAAGRFSKTQTFVDEDVEWVEFDGRTRPGPGLFVARVVGESMNRRIPNGAWCLWRANPGGTRQGKVVLAQHRDIADPEHDGRYTVKVYESEKVPDDDVGWAHSVVRLKPQSTDPGFEPIVLKNLEDGALEIVAELVEVLGPASG